ncbi:NADH kinase [Naematelia encephala]|uniref:NADH kinase n=1 Tax=Naematelia encephala TaxID=71784 RepID=A0A1Y2B3D8_9TREE|nr:NADH kinase [Naematelia encephala]
MSRYLVLSRQLWSSSRSCSTRSFRRGVHQLRDLPAPTIESLAKRARLRPCDVLENEAESSAMGARQYSPAQHLSKWNARPKTVLLVQKPDDDRANQAVARLLRHLTEHHPYLTLLVEPHTARYHDTYPDLVVVDAADQALLPLYTDLVITVGGDGTVLHTSHLFAEGECPPVLSFSMGSLGFLLPFHIDSMAETLEMTLAGPVSILNRMRLACTPIDQNGQVLQCAKAVGDVGWQVMNEVTLHRGRHAHLTVVDAYFDGQHLTEAMADGLLLSTPTGSTAYSLSAGGPISHPGTDAFLLTPIAPRSLSFRTVILPGSGVVKLEISPLSRSPAELSVDGREVCELRAGEAVIVGKSRYPIPCVERAAGGSGWVRDINSLLQFNVGFRNKSLRSHHEA